MHSLHKLLKNKIVTFDGAMGTMLQQSVLRQGELPELLNLSNPDEIIRIHRLYAEAGADIITANTFQAHELKLGVDNSVEEVVAAGVDCAKRAGAGLVALDVGPLGQLMEPMGTISFERAYSVFKRQMEAGQKAKADLILIETISDIYEAKAAVLAAKENTDLPVICTLTFQDDYRTFVGCDALTAVIFLQDIGVDALGVNCSLGPDKLVPVVEEMLKYSRVPVLVQPNAGLPKIRGGQTVFDLSPEDFCESVLKMVRKGVRLAGGCCGTTPEHIRLLSEKVKNIVPEKSAYKFVCACTSGLQTVILDNAVTEIGERINPTGKPKMREALKNGRIDVVLNEAVAQVSAGAHVLDVNVGLPDIDEPKVLADVIKNIQSITTAPLQIDSSDTKALEAGLRVYNGKPILNSVSGKQTVMEEIFPLAKKYGALVIGLTLDENGIPKTAEERFKVAEKILNTALSYGIPKENLIIDCLVLTVSAQQDQVMETLKCIRLVKSKLNLKTILGVSNVSFGLPERDRVNSVFLSAALGAGLDAAILNPLSEMYRQVLDVYRVLNNEDKNGTAYIEKYSLAKSKERNKKGTEFSEKTLPEIIEQGLKDLSAPAVTQMLKTVMPIDIIDQIFVPALNKIGKRFESGEIFLPQLMLSAQTVQNGFEVIWQHMQKTGIKRQTKGRIILATVYGDVHDIGKNIVHMLLKNYGYDIIDLGKDVRGENVIEAVKKYNVRLVGLSALMTTTVKNMKNIIEMVKKECPDTWFMVGGAVLNQEYAVMTGADFYAGDAMDGVTIANRFFN